MNRGAGRRPRGRDGTFGPREGAAIGKREVVLPAAVVCVLTVVAAALRWVQDDAFISFRYAANLLAGHGLVFNVGERVEGYTNFLWTLLMAGGMALGAEPVLWSQALGIVAFVVTLAATWRLARLLRFDGPAALAMLVAIGTNYSLLKFATGGLETALQAALHTLLAVATVRLARDLASEAGVRTAHLVAYSLLAATTLLNRLDSGVVVGVLGGYLLLRAARAPLAHGRRSTIALAVVGPAAVIVGVWFAWRFGYYGDWLPNTFYTKARSGGSRLEGIRYVYLFLVYYGFLPLAVFAAVTHPREVWEQLTRWSVTRALAAAVAAWALYVMLIGGDYMEFRFLVSVLPMGVVACARLLAVDTWRPAVRNAVVVTLMLASLVHGATHRGGRLIEAFGSLADHMEPAGGDWPEVGTLLARELGPLEREPVIAVAAAGAVPYYSGLPAIDMRGLTDRWVSRNGLVLDERPGHGRLATLAYLLERRVALVVGHPMVDFNPDATEQPVPALLEALALAETDPDAYPPNARFVTIPFGEGLFVTVLDLGTHRGVRRHIDRRGWPTVPVQEPEPMPVPRRQRGVRQ